ncbi:MAG: porin [Ramlibacter sp.]
MKKQIAGLIATACLAPAAHAQSQIQLYGVVDIAAGRLSTQAPGAPNAAITNIDGVHNGGVTTSFFGFRGTEDLGGGLKANFQLEAFFRADTGASGRFGPLPTQDAFFSRVATVGLQGNWGEVKLGAIANPAWLSLIFSSPFGGNSVVSPAFRQQFNGSTRGNNPLDTSLPNSIAYTTPSLGGAFATLAVQAREATPGGSNLVGNVIWRGGPAMLTAAFEHVRHAPGGTTALDQDHYLLGGSYDLQVVKLFAQYARLDNDLARTQDKMPQLGLTIPVGPGEFQLASARDRTTGAVNRTRTTTSLGYIHNLSKRTSVYAMLARDKFAVGTANTSLVGVRHAF